MSIDHFKPDWFSFSKWTNNTLTSVSVLMYLFILEMNDPGVYRDILVLYTTALKLCVCLGRGGGGVNRKYPAIVLLKYQMKIFMRYVIIMSYLRNWSLITGRGGYKT